MVGPYAKKKYGELKAEPIPQACPVVFHVHSYKNRLIHRFARGHGLAPWCFTFAACHQQEA